MSTRTTASPRPRRRRGRPRRRLGLGEAVVRVLIEGRVDARLDVEVEVGDEVGSGVGIRAVGSHGFHVAWERPVDNVGGRLADRRTGAPFAGPRLP